MENPSSDQTAPIIGRKMGVLIVEDDERERALLCAGLEDLGFESWSASTGFEAIKLYPRLRDRLSAVILDVKMPGLDGFDTLSGLRVLDSQARVYILTGNVDANDEEELLKRGAAKVFYKPIPLSYLASTLRQSSTD